MGFVLQVGTPTVTQNLEKKKQKKDEEVAGDRGCEDNENIQSASDVYVREWDSDAPYLTAQPIKQKLLAQVLLRNYHIKRKNTSLSQLLICSHEEKKQKRVGLGTGTTKKTNIKYIFMRGAWTLFRAGKKKGEVRKEKKRQSRSPALPTRLVFQKEPYDTLRCWRFKGTCSEGDLV